MPFLKMLRAGDGFPRLDVTHIFFPQAPLLMTGPIRAPLGLLRAPFLANLTSLSWGGSFLEVPCCYQLGSLDHFRARSARLIR